jgi:hypothetical protein
MTMEQIETIDQENIRQKLKEKICQVIFTKVDGTTRVMNCTLNSAMIPAELSEETQKRTKTENIAVQAVYDIEAQGWRSFRWDSVTSFRDDLNL